MQPGRASSRVPSSVVDDEKACCEAWSEGIHQRALPTCPGSVRLGEYPFEHKHHCRRRHVAIVAQHGSRLNQSALCKSEGVLERRDHFGAPRVTDETVDVVDRKPVTGEELRCGVLELGGDEVRNVAGKDRSEAIISDVPTHHIDAAV